MQAPTPFRLVVGAVLMVGTITRLVQAQSTSVFTYQGLLELEDERVSGVCDFEFRIFDTLAGGAQIGAPIPGNAIAVDDGLFTANLTGQGAFAGADRYLEIAVRCPNGAGAFATLSPRRLITSAPYAFFANRAGTAPWDELTGVPPSFSDGVDNDTTYTAGVGLSLSSGQFSILQEYRLPQSCASGQVAVWDGTEWICADDTAGGVTSVTAGAGLTGGGTSGDVNLSVDFPAAGGVNGVSTEAARADHTHYGASWTGNATIGLHVETTSNGGAVAAIRGRHGGGSGAFVDGRSGVWGDSGGGLGVLGTSNSNTGVWGQSGAGKGVYGQSVDASGVVGRHAATNGVAPGVLGETASTVANAVGVLGRVESESPGGSSAGVRGVNNGTATNGMGVYGEHDGGGYGVFGTAPNGIGVFGSSANGTGVRALTAGGILIDAVVPINLFSFNRRFYVANDGDVFADGSYNCGLAGACFNTGSGADVAERIDTIEGIGPGDLIEIDPEHPARYRRSSTPFSKLVAGAISSNPAITLNNNDLGENDSGVRTDQRPLLALVGTVPVKVSAENGRVAPGDLLVASATPGHAMHGGDAPPLGTVIGKALGSIDAGTGVVPMLVMLR